MYLSFQCLRPFSNWDNLQKETTEGLHIYECSNKVVVKSGDQTRAWSCKLHLPKCTPCVGVHLKLSLITRLIVVDPLTSNHFPQREGSLEVEVTCRATWDVVSCPDPTHKKRVWWHLLDPSGFINQLLSEEHIAENTICSATWEILGWFSTRAQHFLGM